MMDSKFFLESSLPQERKGSLEPRVPESGTPQLLRPCKGPHCDHPPTARGLCKHCGRQSLKELNHILKSWGLTAEFLQPGSRIADGVPSSPMLEARVPSMRAMEVRNEIVVLTQKLAAGNITDGKVVYPLVTVEVVPRYLQAVTANWEKILWGVVPERRRAKLVRDIHSAYRSVGMLLNNAYPKRIVFSASCKVEGCEGVYTAVVYPSMVKMPDIVCNRDPSHRLKPAQYKQLRRLIV